MKKIKNKNQVIKDIVIDALFLALVAIFTYVPYVGIITVGPLSFTTLHILVLIAASLFGVKKGTLVGLYFGIFSLLASIQHPGTLDYFCLNPFISILPRVLFGLISGATFDFFKRRLSKKAFKIAVAPIAGVLTFVHTLLFLLCFYIFGVEDVFGITHALGLGSLIDNLNETYGSFLYFVTGFVSIGSVCEIALAVVIVPIAFVALCNVTHSYSYLGNKKHKDDVKEENKTEENETNEIKEIAEVAAENSIENNELFSLNDENKTIVGNEAVSENSSDTNERKETTKVDIENIGKNDEETSVFSDENRTYVDSKTDKNPNVNGEEMTHLDATNNDENSKEISSSSGSNDVQIDNINDASIAPNETK